MKVEEILNITVDNDEWLEVCNRNKPVFNYIDKEALLDYVAMKADDSIDEEDTEKDELDNMMQYDFDAKACLGKTANEVMCDHLSIYALNCFFDEENEKYCSERNLCITCRASLLENENHELECPNGC